MLNFFTLAYKGVFLNLKIQELFLHLTTYEIAISIFNKKGIIDYSSQIKADIRQVVFIDIRNNEPC